VRSSDSHSGFGQLVASSGCDRSRNAEVSHKRVPLMKQDVFWLYVPMDDLLGVSEVEGIAYLTGELDSVRQGKLLFSVEPRTQRLPFHKRHHIVQEAAGLTGIVQCQNVGMLKPGGDSDFTEEAVGTDRCGQLGAENLDGDGPIVSGVMGQINGGHAALADQALDGIAPFERSTQLVERIGH
jgi:hypothetical protein